MQILVATLRGAAHQQQRAAAYAALLPSLICITSQRQRSAAYNNFLHFFRIIAGDFLFMNNNS